MTHPLFSAHFGRCPLVAILRGIRPDEVEAIGGALIESGFSLIEVPLNSPQPLASIEKLARLAGDAAMIGAGTVLTAEDALRVRDAGGAMIVSPNTDSAVIRATADAGMASLPGFFTPTEAFAAVAAGASALKLFPAEAASPAVLKAQRAVLPKDLPMLVVGGVSPTSLGDWLDAGANGFGLGSALYRPGAGAGDVATAARAFIGALAAPRD